MGPDLAKFRHIGNILQPFYAIGQIFIVTQPNIEQIIQPSGHAGCQGDSCC